MEVNSNVTVTLSLDEAEKYITAVEKLYEKRIMSGETNDDCDPIYVLKDAIVFGITEK